MMTAKTHKQQPVVTIRIEPTNVSPAMRAKWNLAWQKIIAKAKEADK